MRDALRSLRPTTAHGVIAALFPPRICNQTPSASVRLGPSARFVGLSLSFVLLLAGSALADGNVGTAGVLSASIATSLPRDGDPAGLRRWLAQRGITYGLIYTGEALGNLSGGVRRGALYEGKLEGIVAADLEKLAGLRGLSFFANAFQIHRTSGARDHHFQSLNTISNIEADPATRLSELWLEQKLFNDRFSIRVGQLAADAEFFISDVSTMFISSDWPTVTAANLPSGGPAYPLATPGIRLKIDPTPNWTGLVTLLNGNPGDPVTVNRTGTNFRVNDPPLLMGELQYRYNQNRDAPGLAGTFRLGAWHHFGRFEDLRIDDTGLSLANPVSSGRARLLRGTSGIYGIVDHQIYRPRGGNAESGISVYSRIAATPADRNLVSFYLDGGVVFAGMLPRRPDDRFGASFIYAEMSNRARAFDRDMVAFTGQDRPIRNYELTFDLTYLAQIKPGWTIQPVFQYVINPGGRVPDPVSPSLPIKGGAVIGVRSTINY